MRGAVPQGIVSQVIAIGGGDLVTRETYEFDQLIASSSGRARPWTLCIAAAANDTPDACNAFGNIYGDGLRCRTDYLRVLKGEPGGDDFQRKIARNEVFYFCDGDLSLLMEAVEKFELAPYLQEAYDRGAIFGGVGAGAAALGLLGFAGDKGTPIAGLGVAPVGIGCIPEGKKVKAADYAPVFKDHAKSPCFLLGHMTALNILGSDYRILSKKANGSADCIIGGESYQVASSVEYAPLHSISAGEKSKQVV